MVRRIIGIDPGSYCTGYGIIEVLDANVVYLASGCIKSKSHVFYERLQKIHHDICDILVYFKPQELAMEKMFIYKNPSSILKLNYELSLQLKHQLHPNLNLN